jgi:hypothetical protein
MNREARIEGDGHIVRRRVANRKIEREDPPVIVVGRPAIGTSPGITNIDAKRSEIVGERERSRGIPNTERSIRDRFMNLVIDDEQDLRGYRTVERDPDDAGLILWLFVIRRRLLCLTSDLRECIERD